jgi:probable rRNA maturation factor
MLINLLIEEPYANMLNPDQLEQAARTALDFINVQERIELSIVVDSDERLQELNKQFLGIDAPTDVLSFPADELDPDTEMRYIGDIILSCPKAQSQALAAGVSLAEEAQLLVVHGVLHLLGHDHDDEENKAAMWSAQKAILASLGINMRQMPD